MTTASPRPRRASGGSRTPSPRSRSLGGRGIVLGGVRGVAAANVMIVGGGVVGMNAAFIALGMEATVFVFDRNIDRLRELDLAFAGRADTCFSSTLAIEERLPDMDLV